VQSTVVLSRSRRLHAYLALTKPRIIELLLITTLPAMALAADGWPGTWPAIATLFGGALTAGGANALNSYLDRDIDEVMRRTARRPLPSHQVRPELAARFGWALGAAGTLWLYLTTNWLAALLAASALLFYVFVYTMALKRTTRQNIVIGGAAGAAPVLVGWAAVTGSLALPAWVMFAVVFAWTPPHFWALALRYQDDYARAGVPMLPVVVGTAATARQMLLYSGVTVLASLALIPLTGLRWIYLLTALLLGGWLIVESVRVLRNPARAMALFTFSTAYLSALFGAILVDRLVF
jgi:protoheme IX farnesyltransferase